MPRKYVDLLAPSYGAGGIDYPYLRYADVLLGLAEVGSTPTTGPTAEAYAAVNLVVG